MHTPELNRIAFIGNYAPRRCGIATYTRDLRCAVAGHAAQSDCLVVAMNESGAAHAYPEEVRFECPDHDPQAYRRAADFLNLLNADVVSLQHEYGIFGGEAGSHVLTLLHDLRAPVHTTLHTVLARPTESQKRVMDEVIRLSARLAVMTDRGRTLLEEVYGVAADRIDVIPHGIPEMEFIDPHFHKDRFGLAGKDVLLTFGLLSPNKGIETVIAALPRILSEHPQVIYVVLGATHPQLLRSEGDRYRESLVKLATELDVVDRVVFHDRYVDTPELLAFIGAADVYVTPYHNEDQITSGTLAYAFGCGKAVVSTPYWHARELLADGRGVIVPFRQPELLAREMISLLGDHSRRHAMRKRAYLLGREMVWDRVAGRYLEALRRARQPAATKTLADTHRSPARLPRTRLPAMALNHLWTLMDSTGLYQHATYTIPNAAEGYCTDDNARALVLMVLLEGLGLATPQTRQATSVLATFLDHAAVRQSGRFRNFLGFDRRWLDASGTDDCLGRSLLALGICIGRSRQPHLQRWAMGLFGPALEALCNTTSPRAWALGILGIHEYLRRLDGDRRTAAIRRQLTSRLLDLHAATATPEWPWLEDRLAYDNARICQALVLSGRWAGDEAALKAGLSMLDWLSGIQTSAGGRFSPVGCKGFMSRGGSAATFDQQPLEAQATISACIEAFHAVGDPVWLERAWNGFEWFRGHNVLGLAICDPRTGGCRDGLLEDRTNENQGAESTLAYLTALAEMHALELHLRTARPDAASRRSAAVALAPPHAPVMALGR